jgi:hypothetical protein
MADTGNAIFIGVPNNFGFLTTELLSSAGSALPTSNLQNSDPKIVARSTALGVWTIDFITPAASTYSVSCLALVNHNFTTLADFQVRADTSSGFASGSLEISSTYNVWNTTGFAHGSSFRGGSESAPNTLIWLSTFTHSPARVWTRIMINDGANPDGYLQAGVLVAGEKLEISVDSFKYGWMYSERDLSSVVMTPNGTVLADKRPKKRSVSIASNPMTEPEAFENLGHMLWRQKGRTDPFVLVLRPNTTNQWHHQAMYCRLASDLNLVNFPTATARYTSVLNFEELL